MQTENLAGETAAKAGLNIQTRRLACAGLMLAMLAGGGCATPGGDKSVVYGSNYNDLPQGHIEYGREDAPWYHVWHGPLL
jgi:hypothetical protein